MDVSGVRRRITGAGPSARSTDPEEKHIPVYNVRRVA